MIVLVGCIVGSSKGTRVGVKVVTVSFESAFVAATFLSKKIAIAS